MAQTRYYRNGSPASTLSGNINAAVTTVPVTAVTTWPSTVPYTVTVDKGLSTAEVMLVTFVSGLNLTVTRGYDGTTAVSHGIGAAVQPTVVALDFTEMNAHTNATTGVHGATGSVVGTTATQTLSGKTLTSPVLTGPSITGGVTVTGTAALAATTASSVTASGTVQGATVTSTGNVGGNTLTTTSNASVGGTLGVTGAVAANGGVGTTTLSASGAASLATFSATSGTVSSVPAGTTAVVNRSYVDSPDTFEAVQTVATTLSPGSYTPLTWTTELLDDQTSHSTVTDTSRVTPTKAGYYRVTGQVAFAASSAGLRAARVRKNGVAVPGGEVVVPGPPTSMAQCVQYSSPVVLCNGSTDYLDVAVYTDVVVDTLISGAGFGQTSTISVVFAHA